MSLTKAILFFLVFLRFVLPCRGTEQEPKSTELNLDVQSRLYASFKYIKNYTTQTYDSFPQNWCILQDQRGVIYAANQGGILEFDGVSWRTIKIPIGSVRSMDITSDGTIYIGGRNEIGFLEPGANGKLRYVSLLNHLNKDDRRELSYVYQVLCTTDSVWFRSAFILYRWHAGKLTLERKARTSKSSFRTMFTWNSNLYVPEKTFGLYQVTGNSFSLISKDKIFLKEAISMVVSYDDGQLLIGTRSGRLYLFDGINVTDFPTEVNEYLENHDLYHGTNLSDGNFALATRKGGLVIIDNKGRLKGLYKKAFGLQDNIVNYVFKDSNGNLWLALNKGISKIEYASPIYFFGDRSGLREIVISVNRHKDRLFVGTSNGLYYLESPVKGRPPVFRPVPGISGNCWSLLSVDDSLLVAADGGVFEFRVEDMEMARRVEPGISCYVLVASKTTHNRVWVGTINGWLALRHEGRQWHTEYKSTEIKNIVRSVVEDESGNLWLGTYTKGVFKVEFSGEPLELKVKGTYNYGTDHGLPRGEVYVAWANGHVIFATPKGIFQFDKTRKFFAPDLTLGKEFAGGARKVFRLIEDQNGHIWFHSNFKNFHALPRPDGTFSVDDVSIPLCRIPRTQVYDIYVDEYGYKYEQYQMVWFATEDGLICYDCNTAAKKNYLQPFSALIRKVTKRGALLYDGSNTGSDFTKDLPILKYKDRNLRFEAAAPFFEDEPGTQYRYFMEGIDDDWSDWTPIPFKQYAKLNFGQYTFQVQARNVYRTISSKDTFSFKVLPPWYFTWWAYLLYGVAAFLMVYLIVKWRSRKLVFEKERLECIVEERTREINQANVQLQQKTIQLEEQSEKLKEMDKIKSRFFANISHEFRTPLTLIMGPLDQIRSDRPDKYRDKEKNKEIEKRIDLAYRSAQRLLGLINQLLDLSKLESGKMKLQAEQRDLIPFLKGILEPFKLAAVQHHLSLTFHSTEASIPLYFDPEKLEKVMGNLLSNAVKFTPRGGSITVSVSREKGNEHVNISVKDTGIGIPENQLAHVFERFYQAETTMEQHHKGSGIGLALSKELVELHHGEMTAKSSRKGENRGTEFILRFPLGKDHLGPEEMAESPPRSLDQDERISISKQAEHELSAVEAIESLEHIEDTIDTTKDTGIESILAAETQEQARKKDIILVVEDNADLRYYMRTSLGPDYTVVEAKDGGIGIEKAKSVIPDLIISDIMMPGVDGYELCRAVKTDISTSHIPVVLLTAKAAEEDIVQGLELGADDYITKPFNTRLLCARIKNLIDLRRQLQMKLNREMVFQPSRMAFSEIDQEFLNDLQEVIEKNLSDPDLNVEMLSKRLYMSRTTLYRKIQALSGEAPTDFIRSYRLMRAVQLLKSEFGSITEVAFEVGFSSRAYFTKCFKEKFHLLPSEYIQSESKPS
ncbi:MAG: response regulator [Candidatus Aminicenantes bacterium]|nr:response regulator [Candidatus Aminicenantes bacterium]NIQ65051.1 response regulator [Candidatus Aminicenantes bacterium]NIT21040.1 response regulator [Candidatus Aminicenantes bacterium]